MAIRTVILSKAEEKAFEKLSAIAGRDANGNKYSANDTEQKGLAELRKENPDFFGWIYIEGTEINYPVMYTPENQEYYLHRAFDGTYSFSGVPFISAESDESLNLIIYGHNMNNGTMFHDLLKYADEEFYRAHPIIEFDTLDSLGKYEILAAFYSKIYGKTDTGFKYYDYVSLDTEAEYREYIELVYESAIYDTGVEAGYGERLITLSTCSYHTAEGRFVVVAREVV